MDRGETWCEKVAISCERGTDTLYCTLSLYAMQFA
jgi:hypothetical protein